MSEKSEKSDEKNDIPYAEANTKVIKKKLPAKPEGKTETIPDFARVAIVPIANPETAPDLLHLAVDLAHPENGKVIALIVSTGTMENEAKAIEELKPIIDALIADGHALTLETVSAPSIARGILDAARDQGADLLILGIQQSARGDVILGTIVENVIHTAPCDVLLYRAAQSSVFKRVVIPIDEGIQAQSAARLGIRIAQATDARIEAMVAQPRYRSQYEGMAYIESTLDGCPGHRSVKRTVLSASNPSKAILTRTTADDLVIVGFTKRTEFERLMFGDLSREMLNHAEGPVIVVIRSEGSDDLAERLRRRIFSWIRPALTRVEQTEIIRLARENSTVNIDYVTLICVSATLASLGLLLNSSAIIIGAMLVAPFMSPLIAFSTGITVGNPILVRRSSISLVIGIILSLIFAGLMGTILPNVTITPELLSRGSPTLLDAAVAVASGVVGAYATARKDIPAALAGVAIAAALMPPLCTVGLGFALGDSSLAIGAAVLFSTNIISIILSGAVVFAWLGMSPRNFEENRTSRAIISLVIVLVFALPIAFALMQLTRQANDQGIIGRELRSALEPAELVEFDVAYDASPTRILATVRSTTQITGEDVMVIEERLESSTSEDYQLELVVLIVVRSPEDSDEVVVPPQILPEVTADIALDVENEATPEVTPER